MQADEIIQKKEWNQLNNDEKVVVLALAENEQEYNLLKKMLLVSAEEVNEVPVVNARVMDELKMAVAVKKNISLKKYWYAAAAAVAAFTIIALFIIPEKSTNEYVKYDGPAKKVQQAPRLEKETGKKYDSLIISRKVDRIPDLVRDDQKNHALKQLAKDSAVSQPQNKYAVFNTSVTDEKDLLALVTEVY